MCFLTSQLTLSHRIIATFVLERKNNPCCQAPEARSSEKVSSPLHFPKVYHKQFCDRAPGGTMMTPNYTTLDMILPSLADA